MATTKATVKDIAEELGIPFERSVYHWSIYHCNGKFFVNKKPLYELFEDVKKDKNVILNNLVDINDGAIAQYAGNAKAPIHKQNVGTTITTDVDEMLQATGCTINFDKSVRTSINGFYLPNNIKYIVNRIKLGRNIYLQGPSGCGKTKLVEKLGEFYEQKIVRVNFSIGTTEQQLVGKFVVKDGRTEFKYGIVPLAMQNGWWIVFDEIDYAQPEHLAVLQPVLEGYPMLITQNENETIEPHPNFRMFATANTKGRGDISQMYTGTQFLNSAFLDRWSVFEMSYTNKEKQIVVDMCNDKIFADQLVSFFDKLRFTADKGTISNSVFSTRGIENIVDVMKIGETLDDAIENEVLSRFDEFEKNIIKEIANDVWDTQHYFKNNWVLGMEHKILTESEKAETADAAENE